MSLSEKIWKKRLQKGFKLWQDATAIYTKENFNPVVEHQTRTEWFALLDERETYLRNNGYQDSRPVLH